MHFRAGSVQYYRQSAGEMDTGLPRLRSLDSIGPVRLNGSESSNVTVSLSLDVLTRWAIPPLTGSIISDDGSVLFSGSIYSVSVDTAIRVGLRS